MLLNENVTVQSVYLSASDANDLLQQNVNNRPKKTKLVDKYADLMLDTQKAEAAAIAEGEDPADLVPPWRYNLPILVVIDAEGHIQNGQHCLSALVQCELMRAAEPTLADIAPLQIAAIIASGVQPVDADLLDTGAARSHADVLFRKQLFSTDEFVNASFTDGDIKKMAKTLGTAAKIVWLRLHLGKKVRSSDRFDHATMTKVVEFNSGLIQSVAYITQLDKLVDEASGKAGGIRSLINPAYAAAAHYLAWHSQQREDGSGMKRAMADGFFKAFATGKPSKSFEDGCPALACRTFLSRLPAKKDNDVLESMYDALVLAWNATKDPKNNPLAPKSPFKVSKKDFPDGYVEMGGLDVKPMLPDPVAEEEAPATTTLSEYVAEQEAPEPEPVPEPASTRPAPPKPRLTAAQKADAAAMRATKAPPKPPKQPAKV